MKILFTVDPEIPLPPTNYGGIERIVYSLIEEYTRLGHDVYILANKNSNVSCTLISWYGASSNNKITLIANIILFTKTFYSNKFDIVHSFGRLAYLTPILKSSTIKIMSYQREPTLSQITKAVKIAKNGTLFFTGCSSYISNQISTVATSFPIFNFAPANIYQASKFIESDAPLIFLGRIEEIKGTHIAIEVAQKTGKRLIIAGNIPIDKESYFENMVKPHLNERIEYVGPVNDIQKNRLLSKSLAFLMPILWNEPFGIVMAEALACGTPVIGFNRGAVPEIVEHGINGFVCSNTNDMIQMVNELNSISRTAVRETFDRKFSDTVIIKEYLNLYNSLLSNN